MQVNDTGSTSYTNAAYSNKGVSGLASGIDTESLVQSMLSPIQTKIDKQTQEQQVLEWKQDIYRSVIDDINDFQSKYLDITSKTSLRLEATFGTMNTTSSSSAVSISNVSSNEDVELSVQVARLATASSVTSSKVSSGSISTVSGNTADFTFDRNVNIKIGENDAVSVDLTDVADVDEICSRINDALGSEFAKVGDDGEIIFGGNESFEITGSSNGMAILGLSSGVKSSAKLDEDGEEIEGEYELTASAINLDKAAHGSATSSVTVTLDGVSKSISITEGQSMNDFKASLQKAFGTTVGVEQGADGNWNISVSGTGRQMTISGNEEAMKAIGFGEGTTSVSTQISRADSISELGIGDPNDPEKEYSFTINGTEIKYTAQDTVSSIMNKINSSDANVKMSYDDIKDTFKIESAATGEGFDVSITGDDAGLFKALGFQMNDGDLDASTVTAGQNAIVNINGTTIERANNSFTYNGLVVNAKKVTGDYQLNADGTFAEGADGSLVAKAGTVDNAAEVTATRNVDKIMDTIKSFVEDYNKLIEKLNKYTHEKATYKKYPPLTAAQKKEMTEKEIELWEEKSKEGLLRNDSEISKFLTNMRAVFYTKGADSKYALSDIGIDSSSNWQEYGKLVIDEDKLRSALENDAEGVKSVFTGTSGVASRLNDVCKKTANVSSGSPGTLVSLAGVVGKASEKNNEIKKKIDAIANKLKSLNSLYETRKKRYWKQFNAMETALSKMNQQSSWLSQQLGY